MKRLKYYLGNMKQENETYKGMYEGRMVVPGVKVIEHNSAMYWDDRIGYEITKSNRIELGKPTIKICIPIEDIGINKCSIASADNALRQFIPYIEELNSNIENRKRTDEENGKYYISTLKNRVLLRNGSYFKEVIQKYYHYLGGEKIHVPDSQQGVKVYMCLVIMIQVQLPKENHKKAIKMLTKDLPDAVNRYIHGFNKEEHIKAVELEEIQNKMRDWLKNSDYCAFIANGSILPRQKDGNNPMECVVPFVSNKENEIEVFGIRGMGILKGVTVITGGGYSGKSTLVDAIHEGVYNHIAGDGREWVITDQTAIKVSAEDGRCVRNVNLSPFIEWIPNSDVNNFTTDHASGSVSQAVNIMEAVEYGSKLFIIDEDKSATNFMVKDSIMKKIVQNDPIVPFVERVNELYEKEQISTILVIGACSEYMHIADRVYILNDYKISCITSDVKNLCNENTCDIQKTFSYKPGNWICNRNLKVSSVSSYPRGSLTEVLAVSDLGYLFIGDEIIDTRMIHNVDSTNQMTGMAFIIRNLVNRLNVDIWDKSKETDKAKTVNLNQVITEMIEEIEKDGLESMHTAFFHQCQRWMDMPRKIEIYAVLNRMKNIEFAADVETM